jgi:bifunctional UDP-N-acetylglucosamine pyrophosphorylase/glucosamine-1-phosphate N-acetyltransferase
MVPDRADAIAVAILAAGKGTRMRSALPKVLHKLGTLTLVERALLIALELKPKRCFAIVGYEQEQVRQALDTYPIEFVEQLQQWGTGHAVQQLLPLLDGFGGDLLVLNADVPLLRSRSLATLWQTHRERSAPVTLLSTQVSDPTGYGRVFCGADGRVTQIIEHRDCTPAQLRHNRINGGIYCFRWPDLAAVLPQLTAENIQQEYYLTDAVTLLQEAVAVDVEDAEELQGINDRLQLAQAYDVLQQRIKDDWMRAGVTFIDPRSCTVDEAVQLEPDVTIEPQTHLRGRTSVKSGSRIGPNSLVENSTIGANSQILYSVVSDAVVGENTRVGPFAHLRDSAVIGDRCRIGNFVEIKNTSMQAECNAAHLSYLGDATLGQQVNIGAGTITANFDGHSKHATHIGDRSRTGSNSVLVAPITLGEDVTVAAGSTVNESVPSDCLVVARSRQQVKPGWRPKMRQQSLADEFSGDGHLPG